MGEKCDGIAQYAEEWDNEWKTTARDVQEEYSNGMRAFNNALDAASGIIDTTRISSFSQEKIDQKAENWSTGGEYGELQSWLGAGLTEETMATQRAHALSDIGRYLHESTLTEQQKETLEELEFYALTSKEATGGKFGSTAIEDHLDELTSALGERIQHERDCHEEASPGFTEAEEKAYAKPTWLDELHGMIPDWLGGGPDPYGGGLDPVTDEERANLNKLKSEELLRHEKGEAELGDFSFKDIRFKEQCLLLSNIQEFARIKKDYLDPLNPEGKTGPNDWGVTPHKPMPYVAGGDNASLMLEGDPYALINVLTQPPNKEEFFEMETKSISTLQPSIRLYKIISDENGDEGQVEMKFASHYRKKDIEEFMLKKEIRGHGVGLKSFNFTYEANNPFAIKKAIRAKLVLHANSFSELLRLRGTRGSEYRYVDLALKTGGPDTAALDPNDNKESTFDNIGKLNFRLKAIVGWAASSNFNSSVISSDLKAAIDNSYITLNLTPTVHHFGFDEMGRTTFTINYLAYVEDFFDQPQFNIFTDADVTANQIVRKLKYKAYSKKCDSEDSQKALSDLKNSEEQVQLIEDEKILNTQALIENMIKANVIRSINVPVGKLNEYRQGGPFRPLDQEFIELIKTTGRSASSLISTNTDTTDTPTDTGDDTTDSDEFVAALDFYGNITFFYISDLMDVILANIEKSLGAVHDKLINEGIDEAFEKGGIKIQSDLYEEAANYKRFAENFKKFRLLLGPVEFTEANKEGKVTDTKIFNLGDIPVSVKYFLEFLTENVLKRERQTYPLPTFLNEFFNQFIRDFLNNDTCYGNRSKQKVRLAQNAITAYKTHTKYDTLTEWCVTRGKTRMKISEWGKALPILNTMGAKDNAVSDPGFEKEINYLTYFVSRAQPSELQYGCKKGGAKGDCRDSKGDPLPEGSGDHEKGIWHYQIGKDRGIVKTIDLVKTESPGLAEVRFEQQGYDGLQQLRVLYDAKIKTFLDVNSYPGAYIYIEPRGFDPSAQLSAIDLTQFGIGGYYMIIRSSHTLGPGQAETEITAKWVAEIDAEIAASQGSGDGTKPSATGCATDIGSLKTEVEEDADAAAEELRPYKEPESVENGAKVADEHATTRQVVYGIPGSPYCVL